MAIYLSSTPVCKRIITSTYPDARRQAFTQRNITHGFKKTGIYPFQPDTLLNVLPQHQSQHQSHRSKPVSNPTSSIASLRQPLASITDNRQLRSKDLQISALRAELSFERANNEKLGKENSVLRKPKITKTRKRNLNQEMGSRADLYDEAAAKYEKDTAEIRRKAAKLRKEEEKKQSDKAVNSAQPSTS